MFFFANRPFWGPPGVASHLSTTRTTLTADQLQSRWNSRSAVWKENIQPAGLGQFPKSLGRSNSVRPGISQRDVNRHVCWELLRRRSEVSGSVYSQASPALRPTASDTGWNSGVGTPKEPAVEAVADHQGPRSENRDQPPTEVGDRPVQRVEKRPVECDIGILRSRRPVAAEDEQTGDESSYSTSPSGHSEVSLSQTLKKPKPLPTCWRLSFSQ